MVDPPIYISQQGTTHAAELGSTRTKGKVPKLLTSFDLSAFFNSGFDTTHHHSTDTYGHNAPKSRTIDGNDLASVFAINVEGRADGLRLRIINQIGIEGG